MRRESNISRICLWAIGGMLLGPTIPVPAAAALLSWNNAAGGAASIAANWSPVLAPAAGDDLTFNLPATYAVTYNASVTASRTQTFRQGTVTLTMSSPHTTSTGITIGNLAGDVATTTLTTGAWNCGGPIVVGSAASSNGTLNVNDDDADLLMTGATSDMTIGVNAPGTLNITGGGLVQVSDQFIAGSNAAGTATVTVSGATSTLPVVRSSLIVNGAGTSAATSSKLGQGGDATVNISNGALADFAGDVVVANGSLSESVVTIAGTGGLVPQNATLDVAASLLLGRNHSAGVLAGAATLNVNAGGRVFVGDTLFVAGDPDGGTATLHLDTGGLISTRSLHIGSGATLDLDGGTLDIDGGTLTWSTAAGSPRFNGGASNPVITLKNGATAVLTPSPAGPALTVGGGPGANFCDFDVRAGADLVTNPSASALGSVMLGEDADDDGSMTINGVGSTMTMGTGSTLSVGGLGDGRFEAELGAVVSGSILGIAANATSNGLVLIENAGTEATFSSVYVGGRLDSAGGNGELVVNAQAVLNINAPGVFIVWPPGLAEVTQGATLNAGGINPLIHGRLELENGAMMIANLTTVTAGGLLRGPGNVPGAATLDSDLRVQSGGVLELVNGNLTVGRSTSPDGFDAQNGSLVVVGAHTLTVHDQNRALFDEVTINGGHIIAPNGIEIVTPGQDGRLDGTGTITGRVFMESGGSVITATGANGITINGQFRNNSGNIDGTRYTFNANPNISDSGWLGAGAINAKVTFNAGTKVIALANMAMGDGSTTGVTFNNGTEMHMRTRVFNLNDSNGVGLPNLTDMNGGDLISQNGLVVNTGRVLRGKGDIDVFNSALSVFGTIDPANDDDADDVYGGLGAFDVAGAYTQGVNSHYYCEIAGYSNEFQQLVDFIDVSGAATLNGTLHLSLIDGYVPQLGDVFNIMRHGSRSGTFATIDAPCLRALGLKLSVVYTAVNVQVRVVADSGIGDMNCDCAFNNFDIDPFVLALVSPADYAAQYPGCNPLNGDVNNDGALNNFDIDPFVTCVLNGACP
ncbi:MAG: hypothetical protein HRU75_08925 [Planctomycetia bacterium]|nr:MAG: hypothetical protein HRU75_08925 [Planctomycetia bacterium]